MRETKFRGLRLDGKGWVFGDYFYLLNDGHTIISTYHDSGSIHTQEPPCDYQTNHEIAPQSLGEITGLKDKNGKDIYEGDIIESYINLFKKEEKETKCVEFKNGSFYCGSTTLYNITETPHLFEPEVVGNIHKNP